MNVGDIQEHKIVNAKTGEIKVLEYVVTQEEVDIYEEQQLEAQKQAIINRLLKLDEIVSRKEEERHLFDLKLVELGIITEDILPYWNYDDVVKENKGTVIHTAVGSPIVARVMIDNKSVFGGEENGGLIFPELQYCRDSAMTIAKILEIMAKENKKLSELIDEIPKYEVFKTKMPCPHEIKDTVMKELADKTKNDSKVIEVDETDGVKLYVEDGWVLMRPSGTEPIFRVYSESKNKEIAEKLATTYKKITEDLIKDLS